MPLDHVVLSSGNVNNIQYLCQRTVWSTTLEMWKMYSTHLK